MSFVVGANEKKSKDVADDLKNPIHGSLQHIKKKIKSFKKKVVRFNRRPPKSSLSSHIGILADVDCLWYRLGL